MGERYRLQNFIAQPEKRVNFIIPAAALWGAALILLLAFVFYENETEDLLGSYYLLPWCFLTGAVLCAPGLYLWYKNSFDLFHPLVFAAWSYLLPAFFLGGLFVSGGFSQPYFLNYIHDERYNLPLTLVYVMIGYLGLTAGFFLPLGRKIGEKISPRLPQPNWQPAQLLAPGLILLGLGLANNLFAFSAGVIGFQKVDEIGMFDGIIFLLTLFWLEAAFLLWLVVFRTRVLNFNHYLVVGILLAVSIGKSVLQGNRGSLIQVFILVAFAFVMSGRKISFKHKAAAGILLLVSLFVGMIYGTTFRSVKQTQERVSFEEYAGNIADTFGKISEQDVSTSLHNSFAVLAERIDAVSPLAVVVSNYEALAPYEEVYGLDNNIWKDTVTFLIPRVVWPDKPLATDPAKYADLYFNYSESAFTLTPFGDLLRNFGPVGVPLGMLLLGMFLRVIYAGLIENQDFSFWRATLYYMLLTSISYEGSYGYIVPYLGKVGLTCLLGLIIVWFFVRSNSDGGGGGGGRRALKFGRT
jgi:hypothetical protein